MHISTGIILKPCFAQCRTNLKNVVHISHLDTKIRENRVQVNKNVRYCLSFDPFIALFIPFHCKYLSFCSFEEKTPREISSEFSKPQIPIAHKTHISFVSFTIFNSPLWLVLFWPMYCFSLHLVFFRFCNGQAEEGKRLSQHVELIIHINKFERNDNFKVSAEKEGVILWSLVGETKKRQPQQPLNSFVFPSAEQ